jgi:hypothetical protein
MPYTCDSGYKISPRLLTMHTNERTSLALLLCLSALPIKPEQHHLHVEAIHFWPEIQTGCCCTPDFCQRNSLLARIDSKLLHSAAERRQSENFSHIPCGPACPVLCAGLIAALHCACAALLTGSASFTCLNSQPHIVVYTYSTKPQYMCSNRYLVFFILQMVAESTCS